PLAADLNEQIRAASPAVFALLSELGKRIYLPKGILSQTAEANTKAHQFNATRAIALDFSEDAADMMHLPVSRERVPELTLESIYGYAPVLGQQELREAWKAHLLQENPTLAGKTFSLPIVTSGMTHGFSLLAELFVDSGDPLVLPDKIWGNYRLIFQTKAGANIQSYPFFNASSDFNTHRFREILANATAEKLLILLNFPHNPTGYAVTRVEAQQIVDAIVTQAEAGCHILVMVDDAYAGLWYEATVMQESLFGLLVECHPNVVPVKIDGATKEEYAWGLRVAFMCFGLGAAAMQPIEQKLSGLIRADTSGASQVSQTLILEAMQAPGYAEQKQRNYETLKARALKVKSVASDVRYAKLWEVYPSHAGYFTCLNLKSGNAETVRQRLLEEHGIGTIALGETALRIAYSCLDESDIETVFAKIAGVIEGV
ncbi:aminotransferase class I/II-fold pyridoxal phosphate-dependent enzyme, partial [Candidatus Poribacteria bacterium]|nr:aminotransferase class I/II-fold pyridoxal phosphate-dependent enzyme [Candidatus Poribacteria bacterium]